MKKYYTIDATSIGHKYINNILDASIRVDGYIVEYDSFDSVSELAVTDIIEETIKQFGSRIAYDKVDQFEDKLEENIFNHLENITENMNSILTSKLELSLTVNENTSTCSTKH